MKRTQDDFGTGENLDVQGAPHPPPPSMDRAPSRRTAWLLTGAAVLLGAMLIDARNSWLTDDAAPRAFAPATIVSPPASVSSRGTATAAKQASRACGDGRSGEEATPPHPIGNPAMWVITDDYPASSLRRNEQGVSSIKFGIDSGGRVDGCAVSATSGHAALDTAACTAFQRRARFEPARDANGCPVPSSGFQRVRWQIPVF